MNVGYTQTVVEDVLSKLIWAFMDEALCSPVAGNRSPGGKRIGTGTEASVRRE